MNPLGISSLGTIASMGIRRPLQGLRVCLFTLVFTAAGPLSGQSKTDWANLKQLSAGQPLKVVMNDGKTYRCELASASDDGMAVLLSSGSTKSETTLPRADVTRVSTRSKSHRLRNTLVGAGIGAGAGLGFGAYLDQSHLIGNKGKAIGAPAFGALGAAIGALIPTARWQEVYRVH